MTEQMPLIGDVDPSVRRAFDYYPTPAWMTRALLGRVPVKGYILEPCAGQLAIATVLREWVGVLHVETNDLDPSTPCDTHCDAARPEYWKDLDGRTHNHVSAGVTNVAYDMANVIVPLAVRALPIFATVLRLSWLEPTEQRGAFLAAYPPSNLIVMPRHDFKGRGQTDSVTSAWFVWQQGVRQQQIDIVTKDERDELIAQEKRQAVAAVPDRPAHDHRLITRE